MTEAGAGPSAPGRQQGKSDMSGRRHPTFLTTASELLAAAAIGAALLGPALAADGTLQVPSPFQAVSSHPVSAEGAEDLSNLLPVLLTSSERRQLAAELEAAIRQGNLQAAEGKLNAAIEMGTLAIVLIDRLHDPKLLHSLQAFGIKGDDRIAPAPNAGPPTKDAAALLDLQATLAREQAQNSALSQELAALKQEYRGLEERRRSEAALADTKATELQGALRQERERSQATSRELASFQEEHRSLQAAIAQSAASHSARMGEMQQALQQERERNEAASRELAGLREEHRALQSAQAQGATSESARVTEMQNALKQEQERSEKTSRQLASLQDEHRSLQDLHTRNIGMTKTKVSELQNAWQQERARGDDARHQLARTREELRAVQSAQAQSASLESTRMAEMQDALARAQSRGDALAQELARANDELLALRKAQEASAAPPQMPQASLLQVAQPAALPVADPKKRTVASAVAPSDLDLGGIVPSMGPAQAAPPPAGKPASPQASARTDDRLLARADELFRRGDVSGARLLLERSMEAGHPRAAFLLAETFDPHVLSRLGALGIRGDAGKARELYGRARSLGVAQAQERIDALK
jgi:hypothetical protein